MSSLSTGRPPSSHGAFPSSPCEGFRLRSISAPLFFVTERGPFFFPLFSADVPSSRLGSVFTWSRENFLFLPISLPRRERCYFSYPFSSLSSTPGSAPIYALEVSGPSSVPNHTVSSLNLLPLNQGGLSFFLPALLRIRASRFPPLF